MMSNMQIDRRAWIGFGVLLLLVVALGVRGQRAASTVLTGVGERQSTSVRSVDDPHDINAVAIRDSILLEAQASDRNPFRQITVARAVAQEPTRTTTAPAPRKPKKPKLLTLLYDDVAPTVKISVGSKRSDWLHVGDKFLEWKVDDISVASVSVTRRGKTVVLR